MKKDDEIMVDQKESVLKGQHNLAQGFDVSAQSNGNALGLNASGKIVRPARQGMSDGVKKFFKGLLLFRTKRHESQCLPEKNELSFRPKEVFCLDYPVLSDGFRCVSFTQGDVSARSSRNLPWARLYWPFRPGNFSAQNLCIKSSKTLAITILAGLFACNPQLGEPVVQTSLQRVEQMPDLPQPLKIIDWKKKTMQFDSLVYNFYPKDSYGPLIWLDSSRRNIDQVTYGLYTVIGDVRQGPRKNKGEFHEALASYNSLISAGLMGIDKTSQHGFNFVKMDQNYFNSTTKWNIVMNNTNPTVAMAGGGYGRDWWYDVYPNVLYYGVAALFPKVENTEFIQRKVAEQFCKADSVLNGNYDYSYFDYAQMKGMKNNIPLQQDVAGGHAWVLYSAYKKFGNKRYLARAKSATAALLSQKESRFYEMLLPFGTYTAARLNAEQGTSYDVTKMLNWIFDGCQSKDGRYGWGVIAEKWGNYDVSGLQGSITDGGGYAFFMNSVAMAWPLVPMVKYEPQYAQTIGKYMLNVVNAARLFYPDQVDNAHQWLPELRNLTHGIIGYEGIRKVDDYNKPELKGITPVSTGDGPKWTAGQPKSSMFSLYSTSIVGVFGAIVNKTNVDGILALDCNATDFYAENKYPEYLYYNPYGKDTTVTFSSEMRVDLFDVVSKKYLAKGDSGKVKIKLPAGKSALVVILPSGTKLTSEGSKIKAGNVVIAYK